MIILWPLLLVIGWLAWCSSKPSQVMSDAVCQVFVVGPDKCLKLCILYSTSNISHTFIHTHIQYYMCVSQLWFLLCVSCV